MASSDLVIELSDSWADLAPQDETVGEVSSQRVGTGVDTDLPARAGKSSERVVPIATEKQVGAPLIATLRGSGAALPSDGAPHLPNQPNPLFLHQFEPEPQPLAVIMPLAEEPTRSPTFRIPSEDDDEEADDADSRPMFNTAEVGEDAAAQGSVNVEEPPVEGEAAVGFEEVDGAEHVSGAGDEESLAHSDVAPRGDVAVPGRTENSSRAAAQEPTAQPKKRVKRKANRAPSVPPPAQKKAKASKPSGPKTQAAKKGRERRAVIAELGLPVDFPIPAFIERSIMALGFIEACLGPLVIHPDLVADFYESEWNEEDGLVLMERGWAPMDQRTINEIFNLEDIEMPGDKIIHAPSKANLADALKELCTPDARWKISPSGVRTIAPHYLTPEGKFWIHWVKNRFSPTTHDSSVSRERIMIAYCLHKGIKFNLGQLLHRELIAIHYKPKGPLFFPWLVEKLCALAEALPDEADQVEFKGSYDLHSLRRILMGSVDCPKTKKEREEADRIRLRREIKKGKRPAVAERVEVAVSRKRHHVIIQEPSVNSPGEHRIESTSPSSSSMDLVPQDQGEQGEDRVPPHSENSEVNPTVEGAASTTVQRSPVRDEMPAVSNQLIIEDGTTNDYAFMDTLFAGPCRSDPMPSFTFGQDSNSGRESADSLRKFVDKDVAPQQQPAAQSADKQHQDEALRLEEERRHMVLPTPLGRFLTNDEMATIQANSTRFMRPGANFQVPAPGEPAVPDFTPEQPSVRVAEDPVAPLPPQSDSERKAYLQGFEHGQKRMVEALRWEVVKPIVETVKAMQHKIDMFMTAYTHNETVFNLRCTGSTTEAYSEFERVLLQPTPYPDLGPFHPPPHYGVPPPPQDRAAEPTEDNPSNPNV